MSGRLGGRSARITIKIPRVLWKLFMLALLRNELTIQEWFRQRIDWLLTQAPQWLAEHRESKRCEAASRALRLACEHSSGRDSYKQLTARVAPGQHTQLRREVDASDDPMFTIRNWFSEEIQAYTLVHASSPLTLLPQALHRAITPLLPADRDLRRVIGYALLRWKPQVVANAMTESPDPFQRALASGNIQALCSVLDHASRRVEYRRA